MIDGDPGLQITQQARAFGINCRSDESPPGFMSPGDLAIMRRMDQLHLDFPLREEG